MAHPKTTTSLKLARLFDTEAEAASAAKAYWEGYRDARGNRAANGRMCEAEYVGSQRGYVVRITRANACKPSGSLFLRENADLAAYVDFMDQVI